MITYETIISQELRRPDSYQAKWSGHFWVREFTWLGLRVVLRQWRGTRDMHELTGSNIVVSLPRYWWFLWRLRRERHAGSMPQAKVVRR